MVLTVSTLPLRRGLVCVETRGLSQCGGKTPGVVHPKLASAPQAFHLLNTGRCGVAPYCRVMGQQNTEKDVEALQKSGRRRGSCLDIFLVMSIILLFAAVVAVAVVVAKVVMEHPHQPFEFTGSGQATDTAYKVKNGS